MSVVTLCKKCFGDDVGSLTIGALRSCESCGAPPDQCRVFSRDPRRQMPLYRVTLKRTVSDYLKGNQFVEASPTRTVEFRAANPADVVRAFQNAQTHQLAEVLGFEIATIHLVNLVAVDIRSLEVASQSAEHPSKYDDLFRTPVFDPDR